MEDLPPKLDTPVPPIPVQTRFPADKPVGIAVILMHLTCIIGSFGFLAWRWYASETEKVYQHMSGDIGGPLYSPMQSNLAVVFFVIFVVLGVVGIIGGWGILRSRKWAFILGAGLFALGGVTTVGAAVTAPAAIFHVGGLVYCLMRLIGKLGPLPQ